LDRFSWIDIVAHGEAENAVVPLMQALKNGKELSRVPGIFYRDDTGAILENAPPERIKELHTIGRPAYHKVDLKAYDAYGMISSRGCPYRCSFCSVAPVWNHQCFFRTAEDVVAEMRELNEQIGVELFLFQDEFFVSSKNSVMTFCDTLAKSGLKVYWKAFARVDLADQQMMEAMAKSGCVEIRFGIESGSEKILEQTSKGFTPEMAVDVVSRATQLFPRVDTFFVWGFPQESMDDFYQSLFQMVSFRLMGARILPSLLCMLPQTKLYKSLSKDQQSRLEFCEALLPEYVITGHEVCEVGSVSVDPQHRWIFDFIEEHKDLFSGFFLLDIENNIRPKLAVLQEHGFYTRANRELSDLDSCGAHSPRLS